VSCSAFRRCIALAAMASLLMLTTACGYHTTGNNGPRLPSDLHTMYVPGLQDASLTYHIGQTFNEALIKELRERTNYRIITTNDGTADAILTGTITSVYIAPLTFDSATGRVSTSLVAVSMNTKLVGKDGTVLWSNPSFLFREQYQESTDPSSFFEEEAPAVQRMAKNFSKELVASILEAF
jgi:outer membrane lipopolysaccharide assembly protein LptE/RlpB